AIKALLAVTTYATIINAVINSAIAVVAYLALRPVLYKTGLIGPVDKKGVEIKSAGPHAVA
nr:hypothetical protein [Lachnospiraceae bacterium]